MFYLFVAILMDTQIGDLRDGGVVFWVDPEDSTHGLVCALSDVNVGRVQWGCRGTDISGISNATGNPNSGTIYPPNGPSTEIGVGKANTEAILLNCPTAPAALAARLLGSDWFLPSSKEINEIYLNKDILEAVPEFIHMPNSEWYWTSTEHNKNIAIVWFESTNGVSNYIFASKNTLSYVRAVRAF